MIEARDDRKIGRVLQQLREAESDLAEQFRKVSERHAVEHEVHFGALTLARQCEGRVSLLAGLCHPYGEELDPSEHDPGAWDSLVGGVRRRASETAGRGRAAGLLLLRDLRELHLHAMQVDFHWVLVGQIAQAVRDHDLVSASQELHEQLTTADKWILSQTRVHAPLVLAAPD